MVPCFVNITNVCSFTKINDLYVNTFRTCCFKKPFGGKTFPDNHLYNCNTYFSFLGICAITLSIDLGADRLFQGASEAMAANVGYSAYSERQKFPSGGRHFLPQRSYLPAFLGR